VWDIDVDGMHQSQLQIGKIVVGAREAVGLYLRLFRWDRWERAGWWWAWARRKILWCHGRFVEEASHWRCVSTERSLLFVLNVGATRDVEGGRMGEVDVGQ